MNIGYIRVSTDSQENSVITQKEMIHQFSKMNGITIDDYFIDFGSFPAIPDSRTAFSPVTSIAPVGPVSSYMCFL